MGGGMKIIINGINSLVLEPGLFTSKDSLIMIDRIKSFKRSNIDPVSLISSYAKSESIAHQHKALNLIVCMAMESNLFDYKNNNSEVFLFVNPLTFEITRINQFDQIKIAVMNNKGNVDYDTYSKLAFVKIILSIANHQEEGYILKGNTDRESFSLNCLSLSIFNNPEKINEQILKSEIVIISMGDDAFFADSHSTSDIIH